MKKIILLFNFLFFTLSIFGQEESPVLHKIAHDACPCIEQINLNENLKVIDEAGGKCLEEAFENHVSEILTTYGDDALEEENVTKLGEQIGYILIEECAAFVNFSMRLAEEDKDEIAISEQHNSRIKAKLAPLAQEASNKACKCANDAPSSEHVEEIENTFTDCLEQVVVNDKKLEKKIKQTLNVKKLSEEDLDLFGQEVGLIMLKDCELFRQMVLGEIQAEAAESAQKKAAAEAQNPKEILMLVISEEICDCLTNIPADISSSDAGKEGRKCLENIMAINAPKMMEVYGETEVSEADIINNFQKDMNKKLGAELIKNCPAFTAIGEKAKGR